MIVSMKKTVILCLTSEQEKALDSLAKLGLMHVHAAPLEESKSRTELQSLTNHIAKILGAVQAQKITEPKEQIKVMSGKKVYEQAITLLNEKDELSKKIELLQHEVEHLMPWGEFDHTEIASLRKRGVFVYLCSSSRKELDIEKEKHPDAVIQIIRSSKGRIYYALISQTELDPQKLHIVSVPDNHSLKEAENLLASAQNELNDINGRLDELALQIPQLEEYLEETRKELEFATNLDSMKKHDEIVSLNGFIPVPEVEKLKAAALTNGWALLLQDPNNDELVPTLVKLPKWLNFAKLILDFIGVSQGYGEADVSVCFLFFLTVFFGIIVGDGGYGMIFMAVSLVMWYKFKNRSAKLRNIAKLSIVLSAATLTMGILSGNFFGIDKSTLPKFMQGIDFLSGPNADANFRWLCFLIALIHLSLGRLWRTMLARGWRNKIGEIGWAMLLVGSFYTATAMIANRSFPDFAFVFYGGGMFLTLLGMNWRNTADVFNYPFNVIGTFTDTLSYIRLYAVGLSSVYIAESFNKMGGMVSNIPAPDWTLPILITGAVLIILIGHLLNIALSLMGVLVHGVRLNTLEFSNHMGLQWAGFAFKPFKKEIKTKQGEVL